MKRVIEKLKRLTILFHFDNGIQLFVNRLLWPNRGAVIYEYKGLKLFIDHSAGDQDGVRSCLVPGLYDPCLAALKDLPKSLTIVDLGANGGGFLLFLHHLGFEIGKALCVELNPHTWSRMTLNIHRNIPDAYHRIKIINGAAGPSDGSIRVSLGRGSVGDSVSTTTPGGTTYELPQYSFSSLLSILEETKEIDICKIDIEGAEYEVLKNTTRESLRRCRHIIIEIHSVMGESEMALKSLITSHGYEEIKPVAGMVEDNVYIFSRNRSPD